MYPKTANLVHVGCFIAFAGFLLLLLLGDLICFFVGGVVTLQS